MRKIAIIAAVPALALLMANKGCDTGHGGGVAVSGGGVAVIAHPWVRHSGVWVGGADGWRWLAAGAAGAAALHLILAGRSSEGTVVSGGYGSQGGVPYSRTGLCRQGRRPTWIERWFSLHGKFYADCELLRDIWRKNGRSVKGKDILACITWIFARGEKQDLPSRQSVWSWAGGHVLAMDWHGVAVNAAAGRILAVEPAYGDWGKCARGEL